MWIPDVWSQMTPQSASGLSTTGIPSALRPEEASQPGRAHINFSAQFAGTPAPGFPVRHLRPPKLDPYAFLRLVRPNPPQSALSALSAPVRPVRPVQDYVVHCVCQSTSPPVGPVRPNLPRPGFCTPLRPLRPPRPP